MGFILLSPSEKKRTKRKKNVLKSLLMLNHIRYIFIHSTDQSSQRNFSCHIKLALLLYTCVWTSLQRVMNWFAVAQSSPFASVQYVYFFFSLSQVLPQYYVLVHCQRRNLPWIELLFSLHSFCVHLGKAGCYDRLKCPNNLFFSLICNKVLAHWLSWLYGSKFIVGMIWST